jgi:hypothetical protein
MLDYIDVTRKQLSIDCCSAGGATDTRHIGQDQIKIIEFDLAKSLVILTNAQELNLEDNQNYTTTLHSIMKVIDARKSFSSQSFWNGYAEYRKMCIRDNKINNIIK